MKFNITFKSGTGMLYNHFHNILRLLKLGTRVASRVAERLKT